MLTPRTHRLLDYLAVALFAAAPFALGLDGAAAVACYVLAVVHLGLTVVTRFPVSTAASRPMSLPGHGAIEITVGLILVMMSWLVPVFPLAAKVFLALMGAALVVIWKLTPYQAADDAAVTAPADPDDPEPPPRP